MPRLDRPSAEDIRAWEILSCEWNKIPPTDSRSLRELKNLVADEVGLALMHPDN